MSCPRCFLDGGGLETDALAAGRIAAERIAAETARAAGRAGVSAAHEGRRGGVAAR